MCGGTEFGGEDFGGITVGGTVKGEVSGYTAFDGDGEG